jgi:hypothetical protein
MRQGRVQVREGLLLCLFIMIPTWSIGTALERPMQQMQVMAISAGVLWVDVQ